MGNDTSYFGLNVVDGRYVRFSNIEKLPFFDFWSESVLGSAMRTDSLSGAELVHLTDWAAFARLVIETGRHRYMPTLDSAQ